MLLWELNEMMHLLNSIASDLGHCQDLKIIRHYCFHWYCNCLYYYPEWNKCMRKNKPFFGGRPINLLLLVISLRKLTISKVLFSLKPFDDYLTIIIIIISHFLIHIA